MSATSRALPRWLRDAVPAAAREGNLPRMLLLGGWLSLHLGPLVLALRETGPAALLDLNGLGPLDLMAVWASAEALGRGARASDLRAPLWAGAIFAGLLLLPSTLAAAGGLVLYGAVVAWHSRAAARWGAIGLLGLGVIHLGLALGQDGRSALILWEATATHAAMSWFEPGLVQAGPVLRMPGGHGIAIMAGCSIAHFLPPALLALVVLRRAQSPAKSLLGPVLVLTLVLLALNLLRLMLLTWSPLAYEWGHGTLGTNLFGLLCVVLLQATADA